MGQLREREVRQRWGEMRERVNTGKQTETTKHQPLLRVQSSPASA